MTILQLTTTIEASITTVFDLSRSIDLHKHSMSDTQEQVVSGRKAGLIEQGERVRWRAKHLGMWRELEVEIIQMDKPYSFTDEMIDGDFKIMKHEHTFKSLSSNRTRMTDRFSFQSPYGLLGKMVDRLYLKEYMCKLLEDRNKHIKLVAEDKESNAQNTAPSSNRGWVS